MEVSDVWSYVPLDGTHNVRLRITVPLESKNVPLMLHLRYNTEGSFWRMDVYDGLSGAALASGVPLVTGVYPGHDLLAPLEYLGIGSAFIAPLSDALAVDFPDDKTLGSDFVLAWGID